MSGRGSGAERVDDSVGAFAVGALSDPVAEVAVADGVDIDPVGGEGLDVLQEGGVAAGAEDAGGAEGEGVEADAEAEGAGGAVDQDRGAWPDVGPGADRRSEVLLEEVFGPVLGALPFDSDDEVIALVNDVRFGLAASAWTRDVSRAQEASCRLAAGNLWIDDHIPIVSEMPHGGDVLVGRVHADQARHARHHRDRGQGVARRGLRAARGRSVRETVRSSRAASGMSRNGTLTSGSVGVSAG